MLDQAAANWNTALGAACFLAFALDTLRTDTTDAGGPARSREDTSADRPDGDRVLVTDTTRRLIPEPMLPELVRALRLARSAFGSPRA